MSARFQTFSDNLRTVRLAAWNWQQFEISKLYACAKFEAMSHMTLVLRPKKHPESLVEKAVLLKNNLNMAKNMLQGYMSWIPVRTYQPTFGGNEFFVFFFFLSKSCVLFY